MGIASEYEDNDESLRSAIRKIAGTWPKVQSMAFGYMENVKRDLLELLGLSAPGDEARVSEDAKVYCRCV